MGTNPSSRSNVRRSVRRGEQGREFGNPFEPNTWRSRLEVLPLEGTPESGEGSNAGRISGQDVVHGVADEDGLVRASAEAVER
jgi:hypothetical protein